MAITVKHKYVSAIPDAGDTTVVQPSNWNDTHDLVGTVPIANGGTDATTAANALTNLGAYPASNPNGYTSNTGTVTSVAALTIGTTGTDLSSTVATGTTTPVITLQVPTASAANRGALSSTDWSTFNGKQATLVSGTNIKTVNGTTLLGSGDLGIITGTYGGTGVNNSTRTITIAGNLTHAGAFTQTFTATGNTSVTLPTSGTLLTTAGSGSSLTFGTGSLSLAGNFTTSGAFAQTFTATGTTSVTLPTSGTLATLAGTETFTNKRINLRVQSQTSTATLAINSDNFDQSVLTAQAVSLAVSAPTGTPVNGQKLTIRIEDNGTGRAITWTTSSGGFRVIGTTLPTTTVATKVVYIGAIYNSDDVFWDVVSVAQQA
jgi:hypothetical protein